MDVKIGVWGLAPSDGGRIAPDNRIVFVNDGSKDQTWALISALHEKTSQVSGINLSRNRGY